MMTSDADVASAPARVVTTDADVDAEATARALAAVGEYLEVVAPLPPFARPHFNEPLTRRPFKLCMSTLTPGAAMPGTPWLGFAPFNDLATSHGEQVETAGGDIRGFLRRRMGVIELLVRLAASRRFRWLDHGPAWSAANADSSDGAPRRAMGCLTKRAGFWPELIISLTGDDSRSFHGCGSVALQRGPPRFLVSFLTYENPTNFPELLGHLLSAVSSRRELDLSAIPEEIREDVRHSGDRFTVELGLAFQSGSITTSHVLNLLDVLVDFGKVQAKRAKEEGLEYRVVYLKFTPSCKIASSAVEILADFTRSEELHIRHMDLGTLHDVEAGALEMLFGSLSVDTPELTIPTDDSGDGDAEEEPAPTSLRSLSVGSGAMIPRVASALRYNNTLAELQLVASFTPACARWLAWSLFHSGSASQVQTLHLCAGRGLKDDELTPQELADQVIGAFKDTLGMSPRDSALAPFEPPATKKSPNPAYHEVPMPRDQRVFVDIKAKTKIKIEPASRGQILYTVTNRGPERFEVIRRLEKWFAIVVPGAGAGWVMSTAVVSETSIAHTVATEEPVQTNQRLRSLTWLPHTGASKYSIVGLIPLLGNNLEVLHISRSGLETADLEAIVENCPNLKELNISDNLLKDITPLVTAWKEDRLSKLTTLCTHVSRCIGTSESNQIALQITEMLSYRPTGLRIVTFRACSYSVDELQQISDAIEQSPTLEYVRIHARFYSTGDGFHQVFGKPLGWSPAWIRLPLRAKLAMISVVQQPTANSALRQFDAGVLSTIFQFTWGLVPRVVEILQDKDLSWFVPSVQLQAL